MKLASLVLFVVGATALCACSDGDGDAGSAGAPADKDLRSGTVDLGSGDPAAAAGPDSAPTTSSASSSTGGTSASSSTGGTSASSSTGGTSSSSSTGGTSASSSTGGTSSSSSTGGPAPVPYDAELQHCVDVINTYRKTKSLAPLTRSATIEAFSGLAASSDASTNKPHGYFIATKGGNGTSTAQNEIPGWPLAQYGTLTKVIDSGTLMMWNEGPGGGHYENIVAKHTAVGCGIHVNTDGKVWITQDFK